MSKTSVLDSEQLTDAMYYILLALMEERHGYAIMKFIEDISQAHMHMGPGTLYTLLKKLLKAEWIEQLSDGRTKAYKITKAGQAVLQQEYQRRCRMVEDGKRILQEAGYEE